VPLINWIQRGLLANVLILTGCCVLWVELDLFGAGGRESRVVAFVRRAERRWAVGGCNRQSFT
jgi:hypothetical protein